MRKKTTAKDNLIRSIKQSEKKAKSKVGRLSKKGIRTGNINPVRKINEDATAAELRRYKKELDAFVDRRTQYLSGYDGSPIPKQEYQRYKKIEKQWQKRHDEYWQSMELKNFLTASGKSGVSVAERARLGKEQGAMYGSFAKSVNRKPESFKSANALKASIDRMKREMSPTFQKKRLASLRKNMIEYGSQFNDPSIVRKIRGLTREQLGALKNETNFVNLYYKYYKDSTAELTDEEIQEYDLQLKHLHSTIENIILEYPSKRQARAKTIYGKRVR